MPRILVAIFVVLLAFVAPAMADDDSLQREHTWQLSKISGKAWIREEGKEDLVPVTKESKLFPGQTLITDSRTRLQLSRGKEKIQVGSGTTITLPGLQELEPGKTTIRHSKGTLHLSVQKKNVKHFAVQTPYMVAAVKGTQFSVEIDNKNTTVRVHEGVVGVKNLLGNQSFDVRAGQTVTMRIAGLGDNPGAVPMTFLDRGEEHPEVVAEKARQRAEQNAWKNAGVIGYIIGAVTDTVTRWMAFVEDITSDAVSYVSGIFQSLMFELFGATTDASSVRYWVGLIMAATVVGLALGLGLAWFAVRRANS